MDQLLKEFARAEAFRIAAKRPFIVISYAQSVNGCIASSHNEQVSLSGQESLKLTHRLRSVCNAILVGIETVLSDNPQLNVRLVEGNNPQPIILDTHLRIPLDAHIVKRTDLRPWIVSRPYTYQDKIVRLQRTGATVIPCTTNKNGQINLFALMKLLAEKKISSLMVEGGAKVITSFINTRLVDLFIITITPTFLNGLPVIVRSSLKDSYQLRLKQVEYQQLGPDMILWGRPNWEEA
jgi:3,4-dihydroxy 2-butanone 4-phosphate synthase/GTP cyclohydrolase II